MTERAYKYRFYSTPEQENLWRRTIGCVRLVYNKALATRTQAWYDKKERSGFVVEKLPLDLSSWDCPSCGTKVIDRDINAGKNILAAGVYRFCLWSELKT